MPLKGKRAGQKTQNVCGCSVQLKVDHRSSPDQIVLIQLRRWQCTRASATIKPSRHFTWRKLLVWRQERRRSYSLRRDSGRGECHASGHVFSQIFEAKTRRMATAAQGGQLSLKPPARRGGRQPHEVRLVRQVWTHARQNPQSSLESCLLIWQMR